MSRLHIANKAYMRLPWTGRRQEVNDTETLDILTQHSPCLKKSIASRYHNDYNDQYDYSGRGGKKMSQSISAVEARQKFGEMLNRVALLREEIIIERAGKKIARLSPIETEESRPQGRLDFRKAAGLGKEIWKDLDVDEYLRGERESWE